MSWALLLCGKNNELENARQSFVLAIREKLKTGNSVSYATSLANLSELLHRMNQDAESAVMLKKRCQSNRNSVGRAEGKS